MSTRGASVSIPTGLAIVVGIVVGAGIFKAPAVVAQSSAGPEMALGFWALGGLITLAGALTYAELAAAYPDTGGEYAFLRRAFGPFVARLFGWARLSVIQPGSIAAAAFVLGDYLAAYAPVNAAIASPVLAAAALIAATGANWAGLRTSAALQTGLAASVVAVLALLAIAGLAAAPGPIAAPADTPPQLAVGLAMIMVLLAFGGWNEAAYLSGETKNPQRDMTIILVGGAGIVTALYLLVNLAYFHTLGFSGTAASASVGADLAAAALGPVGAFVVTACVVLAAGATINGAMFTGARSAFALGRDAPALKALSVWDARHAAPRPAVLVQGAITLGLVGVGAWAGAGSNAAFTAMVAYTAPVFWLFFLLTGLACMILRLRDPQTPRPFKVPLYPLTPMIFCAAAGFMVYSSLDYMIFAAGAAGTAFAIGAGLGLVVLAIGLVILLRPARAG